MLATLRNLVSSHFSNKNSPDRVLINRIRWVAESVSDRLEFSRRASVVAAEVGSAAVAKLATQFHGEPNPPEHLKGEFPRLGQWIAARQFAIFEILYYIGTPTLPLLRRVAFGDYDWTQGNAIEVLCRLAAAGVEREVIISELIQKMPQLREEALAYAAGPLSIHARSNPKVALVLQELRHLPEFKEVCDRLLEERT